MGYVNIGGEVLDGEVLGYGYNMFQHGNREWYVFQNEELAGEAAREYWKDLAENDSSEFADMVGVYVLVQWGLGHYASPGSSSVKSLEEWLDLWLTVPEEQWATYDGTTIYGTVSKDVMDDLGFDEKDVVFYRAN